MSNSSFRLRPARVLGMTAALMALLIVGLMATTQGRVLAGNVIRFFSPAPAETITTDAPVAAPPAGATAAPPAFTATGCDAADLACQLSAAEEVTGLSAPILPADVGSLALRAVEANEARQWLQLTYSYANGGGLSLSKGAVPNDGPSWVSVPESAVEEVSVGGNYAEYVRGTFTVDAGATEAVWNPGAPIERLRWQRDGVFYEITQIVGSSNGERLDLAELIVVAESLP